MAAYYNEIDPHAAQWTRNLIAGGHIAPGDIDERSIEDVHPDDLKPYIQCHFFAGIGVWPYALRRAGWPDDRDTGRPLNQIAALSGWATPTTRDWKDTPGMVAQRDGKDRNDQLPRQAYLYGWPIPTANTNNQPEPRRGIEPMSVSCL